MLSSSPFATVVETMFPGKLSTNYKKGKVRTTKTIMTDNSNFATTESGGKGVTGASV